MTRQLATFFALVYVVNSSHYRGATVSWKPTGNSTEILVTYRVSWRRSYGSDTECTNIDINSLSRQPKAVDVFYVKWPNLNISKPIQRAWYYCTDYSEAEDWSTGEMTDYRFNYQNLTLDNSQTKFQLGFASAAWIDLNYGSGNWRIWTSVDLSTRSDTGKINSSPVTAITPIIRLQENCSHQITIPAYDPDGDFIRCRFAKKQATYSECGGVCDSFPGASINEEKCVISYNATDKLGYYAVAVQVEDFANKLDLTPLSSVGLQFLVLVYSNNRSSCVARGTRISKMSLRNGDIIKIQANSEFKRQLIATSGTTEAIAEFVTTSPPGLTKSPVHRVERNDSNFPGLETLTVGKHWYYVNISYTPTAPGKKLFCYTALTTSKASTEQICVTFDITKVSIKNQTHPSIKKNCYSGDGSSYRGTQNMTVSGKACLRWSENPYLNKSALPELGKNYCRNPNSVTSRPWCYVDFINKRWELCDIEMCKNETLDRSNEKKDDNTVLIFTTIASSLLLAVILLVLVRKRKAVFKRINSNRKETNKVAPHPIKGLQYSEEEVYLNNSNMETKS